MNKSSRLTYLANNFWLLLFSMMEMLILLMAPLIVLSLAGLIGVPLANMQVRTIGVLGYAGVAPIVFLLLGVVFGRAQVPIQSD